MLDTPIDTAAEPGAQDWCPTCRSAVDPELEGHPSCPDCGTLTAPLGPVVKLRVRVATEAASYGEPIAAPDIWAAAAPRTGEQLTTSDGIAYAVRMVEYRYDLNELHLFCIDGGVRVPRPEMRRVHD